MSKWSAVGALALLVVTSAVGLRVSTSAPVPPQPWRMSTSAPVPPQPWR